MNMAAQHQLEQKILAALRDAVAENRLDVAEYLLQALEILESEPRPNSSLGKAYLLISQARNN